MKKTIATLLILNSACFSLEIYPSNEKNTLKLRDETPFWDPDYLQPSKEAAEIAARDNRDFYLLASTLGVMITGPSGRTISGATGFSMYGGELGLNLTADLALTASAYYGSSSSTYRDGNYSVAMLHGGFVYVLAKYVYVSAFAGNRRTEYRYSFAFPGFTPFSYASTTNKFSYGFGSGFNLEFSDHYLLRIGLIVLPDLFVKKDIIRSRSDLPIELQVSLGMMF